MRRLLVVDPLSAPNLALRSDLVMFDLLECKYDRNASRNHSYKLQVLGFLWFSSQKLTRCSYSRFFSLLSSVSPTQNLSTLLISECQKSPPFSLPSLFKQLPFPSLQDNTHSHTTLDAHQPPLFSPLYPSLSNLNVGVG